MAPSVTQSPQEYVAQSPRAAQKYRKLLLIYPPFSMETVKDRNESYGVAVLPPLGMLTIAGEVEKHGYEVSFIDAELEMLNDADILGRALSVRPDVVGIYCTSANFNHLVKLSNRIKEKLGAKIFFGGPHVWHHWQTVMKSGAVDYAVIGEGEQATVELLDALNSTGDVDVVKGIAYIKGGEPFFTGTRPFLKNLDELGYPAFHLVDIYKYRPSPQHVRRNPSVTMTTTRGCPFTCTFCYVPFLFNRSYRTRSVDHVIGEIKQLQERYGIKEIQFFDDLFGANKKWLNEFLDRIIDEKIDITWSCMTRIDIFDEKLAPKMKKAGCWCIFFGMESLDQEVLDAIDKKIKVEDIERAIPIVKKAGIEIRANFILGSPAETPEKAKKMISRLCQLNPDYVKFNVMCPYPGTRIFNEIKEGKWGKLVDEYSDELLTNHEVIFVPFGYKDAKEVAQMRRYAFRKFYMRPSYVLWRLTKIRSWFDLVRHYRGFRLVVKRYIF